MPSIKRRVRICFDAHRADGRVWCVQVGRARWQLAKQLTIAVPLVSVYKGRSARQPKAYFTGWCHAVRRTPYGLEIS